MKISCIAKNVPSQFISWKLSSNATGCKVRRGRWHRRRRGGCQGQEGGDHPPCTIARNRISRIGPMKSRSIAQMFIGEQALLLFKWMGVLIWWCDGIGIWGVFRHIDFQKEIFRITIFYGVKKTQGSKRKISDWNLFGLILLSELWVYEWCLSHTLCST